MTRSRDAAGRPVPAVANCSLEWYRWAVRSLTRPSGLRFHRLLDGGVHVPTLQLHGALDPLVLPRTARGSGRYVAGAYEWRELPGVGHFPPEEAAPEVGRAIAGWAAG